MKSYFEKSKNIFGYFVLAIVSFTRIPLPSNWLSTERLHQLQPSRTMVFFPLTGLLLAFFCWVFWFTLKSFMPTEILAFVLLLVPIILTGAYHEDGFADVCDSYGGYTQEQRLNIMKDSRVGSFATVGIMLLLLAKFLLLKNTSLQLMPAALLSALVLGRLCTMLPFKLYPYIGQTNRNANMLAFEYKTLLLAGLIALTVLTFSLGLKPAFVFFLIIQVVAILFAVYFNRKFGGLTGDIGGALEQIGELTTYALFMLMSYGILHL